MAVGYGLCNLWRGRKFQRFARNRLVHDGLIRCGAADDDVTLPEALVNSTNRQTIPVNADSGSKIVICAIKVYFDSNATAAAAFHFIEHFGSVRMIRQLASRNLLWHEQRWDGVGGAARDTSGSRDQKAERFRRRYIWLDG
jgi:hypothetical protein